MALMLHSSSSPFQARKPQFLLPKPHLPSLTKPYLLLSIKSQDSTTEPPISGQSPDDTSSIPAPTPTKKPNSSGLGFGSPPPKKKKKKYQKGKRERASIIRREPVEKLAFASPKVEGESKEQSENERAFLLAWLGLGSIIIIEGILLAASGFLPEEWDNFFVKYLYPSFTPTVFLFVAGTVVYGVLKYLQNETPQNPK